jgi:hypothetical protein
MQTVKYGDVNERHVIQAALDQRINADPHLTPASMTKVLLAGVWNAYQWRMANVR